MAKLGRNRVLRNNGLCVRMPSRTNKYAPRLAARKILRGTARVLLEKLSVFTTVMRELRVAPNQEGQRDNSDWGVLQHRLAKLRRAVCSARVPANPRFAPHPIGDTRREDSDPYYQVQAVSKTSGLRGKRKRLLADREVRAFGGTRMRGIKRPPTLGQADALGRVLLEP